MPHETVERILPQPFAVVGSHFCADIPLPHDQVSYRHAYLQVIAGRVFCVDLHSRTGIFWANEAKKTGWIDALHPVRIGPYMLQLIEDSPSSIAVETTADPLEDGSSSLDGVPNVTLEIFDRMSQAQQWWRMNRTLVLIGNSPHCTIRLRDDAVSRNHCSLLYTPDGLWAVHLLCRDELSVNGVLVRFARLEEGDRLQCGRFAIRPHFESRLLSENAGRPAVPLLVPAARESAGASQWRLENTRALIVPLLTQFNLLHNQSFDQFRQTLIMLFHQLSTQHDDQLRQLRGEFDRLRDINNDLEELKAALRLRTQSAPQTTQTGVPTAKEANLPSSEAVKENAHIPPTSAPYPVPSSSLSAEFHTLLEQRILAMQQERQSRWQKIVNFVLGKMGSGLST